MFYIDKLIDVISNPRRRKWFFVIGIILVFFAILLFIGYTFFTRQLTTSDTAIESIYINRQSSMESAYLANMTLTMRSVLQGMNGSSDQLDRLEASAKGHMIESIRIKYYTIYQRPLTFEEQEKWKNMSFTELNNMNKKYTDAFYERINKFTEDSKTATFWKEFVYVTFFIMNIVGLFFVSLSTKRDFKDDVI